MFESAAFFPWVMSCTKSKRELLYLKMQPLFLDYVLQKIPCHSPAAFSSLYGSVIVVWQCYRCMAVLSLYGSVIVADNSTAL